MNFREIKNAKNEINIQEAVKFPDPFPDSWFRISTLHGWGAELPGALQIVLGANNSKCLSVKIVLIRSKVERENSSFFKLYNLSKNK